MKKKILLAEDDVLVQMTLEDFLKKNGYEIIQAYNGQEAVDLYKEHRPDITTMDIKMPEKTGDVAIKEILEFDPSAKIIAVTAFLYTEEELGVPVLRKPFTQNEFLKMIEKIV